MENDTETKCQFEHCLLLTLQVNLLQQVTDKGALLP